MRLFIIIISGLLLVSGTYGAELQLRDEVRTTGPLVLVGDIADIHAKHSVEAADLAAVDLFPAPPAGEKRLLRLREIQDLLVVRGVNLTSHRFSGSSQVIIRGPKQDAQPVARPPVPTVRTPMRKIVKQPIEEATRSAIKGYLNEATGKQDWQITLALSDEQINELAKIGDLQVVTGGSAPWIGDHEFTISNAGSDADPVVVTAQIALQSAIVVARTSLPKGTILRADDVKLQRGLPTKGEAEVYQSIEDVVGKETTRVITEGQILDNRTVRRQLLTRKNEIVSLYSRAAGVCVRTTARVRDDGAEGDLVTVESLQDRKPLLARVSGPQEVEIFAQAVSTAEPTQQTTK